MTYLDYQKLASLTQSHVFICALNLEWKEKWELSMLRIKNGATYLDHISHLIRTWKSEIFKISIITDKITDKNHWWLKLRGQQIVWNMNGPCVISVAERHITRERHVSVKIMMASTDRQCLKGPTGLSVLTVSNDKVIRIPTLLENTLNLENMK